MNIKPILLIGGAFLGIRWLMKKNQDVSELANSLIFNPKNIQFNGNVFAPKILLFVGVTNPTTNTVTINKIFATIKKGSEVIGTINSNTDMLITPSGESQFIVPITLNTSTIITDIIEGNFSGSLNVSGYYQTGTIQIPFTKTLPLL